MSRRPNDAAFSRRSPKARVPEQPESSVGNDEQDESGQGEQDHQEGSGDGEEARLHVEPETPIHVEEVAGPFAHHEDIFKRMGTGDPPSNAQPWRDPTAKFTERWRDTVNGLTYRVIVYKAYSFYPERISMERMISQGNEPETWTAEVMPQ